ncbi:MAG: prepilin-type N-terminal cleavage/methylation domain-containing protein [Synergistaceae bacterium]|jgi:prepilin-type N-terminal cleavage/methylation domain-containing protein|nr:prepilin-type N-terminal cleavage/methylation domain-containing protein [Synergistaceae bacterium]
MKPRPNKKRAFTLVEIMLALGIGGMILALGIAPLMFTARTISQTRANFASANRERAAVNRIFQDVRESVGLNVQSPVFIARRDSLEGGSDNMLMVWTIAPAYAGASMGSVVYGVPRSTVLGGDFEEGVYRWVLSDDTVPGSLGDEDLEPETARLLLGGVKGVSFHALSGSSWTDSYNGSLPRALRVTFQYEDGDVSYEDLLPNF